MSLEIAISYHQQGDFIKAEEQYRKILQEEPENADALHLLGVLLSQMSRYEAAIELIEKAINISPQPEYYNNLGAVFFHLGEYGDAIQSSEKALQIDPEFYDANFNLGNALFQSHQYNEALKAYDAALQGSNNFEAHYNKANTLIELDRINDAVDELNAVIDENPRHVDSYNKLVQLYEMQGDLDAASKAHAKLQEVTGEKNRIPFLTQAGYTADSLLPIKSKGGFTIGVPNNIQLMTPYVLLEQEDWFEDEIKFIRKMLQPGMNAIDIGANYGIYSMSIASAIYPGGTLWSFEPTASIVPFIEWSMDENNIDNMFLIEAALSDHEGQAWLNININSELNEIAGETGPGKQAIDLMTIDQCEVRYNWDNIDFIKLDAEGQESNIIKGAVNFLSKQSPLVLIEIKHNDALNIDLVHQFESMGYSSYRLIPGLDILVPFSLNTGIDPFLLNIFCCKKDRANKLHELGFLTDVNVDHTLEQPSDFNLVIDYLNNFPYAKVNLESWKENYNNHDSGRGRYYQALVYYVLAHQASEPGKAYAYLLTCRDLLEEVNQGDMNVSILQTYSRVLWEVGERSFCLHMLKTLENHVHSIKIPALDEPFIAVSKEFESREPAGEYKNWLLASIIEQIDLLQHYSSYFNPEQSLVYSEKYNSLGYPSPAMERRKRLIILRSNPESSFDKNSVLLDFAENNLNPGYWS